MDAPWWLKELAILIVVCEITTAESDLLESLQPKEDNPPELNDFLASVLEHKNDFDLVREAARKYRKMKKDAFGGVDSLAQPEDFVNDFDDDYKIDRKRYSRVPYRGRKRYREQMKRSHRFRRHLPVQIFSDQDEEAEDIGKRIKHVLKKSRRDPALSIERSMPVEIFTNPEVERIERRVLPNVVVEPEGEKGKVEAAGDKHPKLKKAVGNLESPSVHKTYKEDKGKKLKQMKKSQENRDFYYVDLDKSAEEAQERRNDRRGYRWYPRPQYYSGRVDRPVLGRSRDGFDDYPMYETEPLHHNLNDEVAFEKALSYEIEPVREGPSDYNNPQGNNLYSVDEGRPDNVEPLNPQREFVQGRVMTAGQAQDVTNERFFMDDNNNLRKSDNSMHAATNSTTTIPVTTTSSTVTTETQKSTDAGGIKVVKQVGEGFIEITKAENNHQFNDQSSKFKEDSSSDVIEEPLVKQERYQSQHKVPSLSINSEGENRSPVVINEKQHLVDSGNGGYYVQRNVDERDEQSSSNMDPINIDTGQAYAGMKDEDDHRSNILFKNSLHPLRLRDASVEEESDKFQSRKLQFVDERMVDFENQDDDYSYVPHRTRRDFLDALGMKNEEDYSEDNPYKDIITDNNTDINNDTFYKNLTSKQCSSSTTTIKPTTDKCVQKQDMNTIKQILEEPKEVTEQPTVGSFKQEKEKKRLKKSNSEISEYEQDVSSNKERTARHIPTDIETKILENKDKIYNYKEDSRNRNFNSNYLKPVKRGVRPQNWIEGSRPIKTNNNVKKSADLDVDVNTKEDYGVDLLTTTAFYNYTEMNEANLNSTYEQVAYQMDMENEKLAQVVNGHLASKIVSTVFDQLKERTALKTKFYPGLSRKHVNYAGTIDFDIFQANETEDVNEARLLLEQITKVLNKLVLNQVRRKLCQRLPDELKEYLGVMVSVKNSLQTNSFEPNTNQGSFLFTYQEKSEPPFDVKRLEEVLAELEGLLLSYHSLNSECQDRVEPVKDYIEKHVKVLKKIVSCPTHNCEASGLKRNTKYNRDLTRKQLHSVGLGVKRELLPNFDITQLVKSKTKNSSWKTAKKRDAQKKNTYQSNKYRKLQQAAEKIREKRAYEKKIAEMFGGKKKRSVKKLSIDYEEPVVYSLG